jgi:alkaline phosphatase D
MSSHWKVTVLATLAAAFSAPILMSQSAMADEYASAWAEGISRPWIGPDVYANRLQDWRLADGRVECVEAGAGKPMRVAHILPVALNGSPGGFEITVRLGAIEPQPAGERTSWAGLLIGAGGAEIDYRLTAFVHHRPAEDGGLIAAVESDGRVVFRDNETNQAGGGTWTITGPIKEGELLEIPASDRLDAPTPLECVTDVMLTVAGAHAGDAWTLTLTAADAATGDVIDRAVLNNVAPTLVEGGVGLVSHFGPGASGTGYWFDDLSAAGESVDVHADRFFGPVWCAQYTISDGVLKMTAQMPPLGENDTRTAELQTLQTNGDWLTIAKGTLVEDSWTIRFRVEDWIAKPTMKHRVRYALATGNGTTRETYYEGTIQHEPTAQDGDFVIAAFTGNKHFTGGIKWNHDGVWFPHRDIVRAVRYHNPDLLFFSGDQIYEGDLTGAQRKPLEKAMLDYHDKWRRWCWAFQELTRDRPCICIPDDHDVYHGNLWGAGGRAATRQDDGGYTMPASFVNMVERTQTSHLPDAWDPTPVEQGIGVYYTDLRYGGISFAIIEDRKFKSSATPMVPEGEVVNGWFQNPEFDPALEADVEGAELLGARQEAFLEAWANDWSDGLWMKCVLSQTIFANVATLPEDARSGSILPSLRTLPRGEYPENYKLAADCDSNGWPQTPRNTALRAMRKGFAMHIAGDQHLGTTIQYGVDDFNDAGFALCVPSIANTWPRRWFPPEEGLDRPAGAPKYAGKFLDGFGNHVTVHAVSNPVSL